MKKNILPQTNTRKGNGFTLLEIIIAVGIFTFVILLSTGGFLSLSSVQKNVQNTQEVLNEFRFAIDLMGREVTFGRSFPDTCKDGCDNIKFVSRVRSDVSSKVIHYYLDAGSGRIIKGKQKTFGACFDLIGDPPFYSGCYQPFTSDKIYVDSFNFFVDHEGDWEKKTIVTIAIEGRILPGTKDERPFQISSSYSLRFMQNPNSVPPLDNVPPNIVITSPWSGEIFLKDVDTVPIDGTASDNIAIKEVRWENEESGYTGYGFNSTADISNWLWSILPFRHLHVGSNVLNATAVDEDGNSASDSVTITRQDITSLPKPVFRDHYQYCSGADLKIKTRTDVRFDAEKYHIYRCDEGANPGCTPTYITTATKPQENRDSWARAEEFDFYTSNDGVSWNLIVSGGFPLDNNESAVYFTEQNVKYIRFVVTKSDGTPSSNGELTLIQPHGAPVPKAGWSAIDVDPACSAGNASDFFDGDPMESWHTGSGCDPDPGTPHSIDIDLGGVYRFNKFHYTPHQSLGWISISDGPLAKGTYSYTMVIECERCTPDVYSPHSDISTVVADMDCVGGPAGGANFSLNRSPDPIKVKVDEDPSHSFTSDYTRIKVGDLLGGFSSTVTLSIQSCGLPGVYIVEHQWPDGKTISSENYAVGVRYRLVVRGSAPISDVTYPITIKGTGGGDSDTVVVHLLVQDEGTGAD